MRGQVTVLTLYGCICVSVTTLAGATGTVTMVPTESAKAANKLNVAFVQTPLSL